MLENMEEGCDENGEVDSTPHWLSHAEEEDVQQQLGAWNREEIDGME
jgi:hypothetical protein